MQPAQAGFRAREKATALGKPHPASPVTASDPLDAPESQSTRSLIYGTTRMTPLDIGRGISGTLGTSASTRPGLPLTPRRGCSLEKTRGPR